MVWLDKNSLEGNRDVEKKTKQNKGCLLASLGNLLLPRANEGTSINTINSCVNFE